MTRIAMTISEEMAMRAELGELDLDLLKKRLLAIPMVVFRSGDVQFNPPVVGKAMQAVMRNGRFEWAKPSSVTLEFLHVHEDVDPEDNNLAATIALAAIWDTLPRNVVSNPNAVVLQNGHTSYGWDEMYGRAESEGWTKTAAVIRYLDDFIEGRTDQATTKNSIRRIFSDPDGNS